MKVVSSEKVFLSIALLVVLVGSSTAKTIEKREATDYFTNYVDRFDQLKSLPFVGALMGPYIGIAQTLVRSVDTMTDHDLSGVFNSVMPCNLTGGVPQCDGTVDQEKLRHLAKKLLTMVPLDQLPPSMAAMLQLVADMI